ncbi:MAG: DUF1294 domain-containing protein [Kofleriaceae bacterium]
MRAVAPATILLAAAAAFDLIAWLAFRLDKARARRRAWRIPERTLLLLASVGGVGALIAMYAHRQRHKTRKAAFVAVATLGAVAQVAGVAWLLRAP